MITQNTSNIVPFDAARRISDHSTEKERENMARATLEALVGTLPDPEWQRMRADCWISCLSSALGSGSSR